MAQTKLTQGGVGAAGGSVATAVGGQYRIGELASRVGLTERTIRYYEELGLLESVKRLDGGVRVYTDDDVRRLRYIRKLKTLGLSLQEMLELEKMYQGHRRNSAVLPRLMELLDAHLATLGERMTELGALRDEIRSYREHVARRLLEERAKE
ncbi:MAG TPA: MerR family transcriptional regulator [Candidatus Limnocylindrales bacterium]|nr:MerR family transcriptional regulator [Candidatus Limnocylindrales bacterium]